MKLDIQFKRNRSQKVVKEKNLNSNFGLSQTTIFLVEGNEDTVLRKCIS